jgi:hypothetical protein
MNTSAETRPLGRHAAVAFMVFLSVVTLGFYT